MNYLKNSQVQINSKFNARGWNRRKRRSFVGGIWKPGFCVGSSQPDLARNEWVAPVFPGQVLVFLCESRLLLEKVFQSKFATCFPWKEGNAFSFQGAYSCMDQWEEGLMISLQGLYCHWLPARVLNPCFKRVPLLRLLRKPVEDHCTQ